MGLATGLFVSSVLVVGVTVFPPALGMIGLTSAGPVAGKGRFFIQALLMYQGGCLPLRKVDLPLEQYPAVHGWPPLKQLQWQLQPQHHEYHGIDHDIHNEIKFLKIRLHCYLCESRQTDTVIYHMMQ